MREAPGIGKRKPRETGASRDPYLRERATWPDYAAYLRWCQSRGVVPLKQEPLAYGDAPPLERYEQEYVRELAARADLPPSRKVV